MKIVDLDGLPLAISYLGSYFQGKGPTSREKQYNSLPTFNLPTFYASITNSKRFSNVNTGTEYVNKCIGERNYS